MGLGYSKVSERAFVLFLAVRVLCSKKIHLFQIKAVEAVEREGPQHCFYFYSVSKSLLRIPHR